MSRAPGTIADRDGDAELALDDPSSTSATPIRSLSRSRLRISNARHAHRDGLRPAARLARRSERRRVRPPFNAGLELDERAKLGNARDAALAHLPHVVSRRHRRPRIRLELLQAQRNLPVPSSTRRTLMIS